MFTGGDFNRQAPLPLKTFDSLHNTSRQYLVDYKIDEILSAILRAMLTELPPNPIQYIVDCLTFGDPVLARQDARGLSEYRKRKLLALFHQLDKDDSGSVELMEIQRHSAKYGGLALTEEELRDVFADFDVSGDNKVSAEEFLDFFAKALVNSTNEEFEEMLSEMME